MEPFLFTASFYFTSFPEIDNISVNFGVYRLARRRAIYMIFAGVLSTEVLCCGRLMLTAKSKRTNKDRW
jgi:hypothetical protein